MVVLLLVTRWPLIPAWLVNFDLANFAFALEEFNPAEHKPQPPGYPLYVGLTRLVRLFSDDVMVVFAVAGLIGCLVALLALARLAEVLFGLRAAVAAAVLLLFHPALWTEGILNPVRVFLVAGSAGIGLLAWQSWRNANRWWTAALWATLGVAAGFRPGLGVLMLPLCVVATLRRRSSATDWALASLAMLVGLGSWLVVCVRESGGFYAYVLLLVRYLDAQSESTSVLFGASLIPALKMAGRAVIWTAAPVVAWLWAAPLVSRSTIADAWRKAGLFIVLWGGPSFLFSTLVHSAEPGHILPMVAPLCLIGAFVVGQQPPGPRVAGALAVAAAINIALFYWPPLTTLRASSVRAVRAAAQQADHGLTLVSELRRRGPLAIIASPHASVSWRVLSYYHRDKAVVVLHSDPVASGAPGYWLVRNGKLTAQGSELVRLPDCGKFIWFLSPQSPLPELQNGAGIPKREGAAIVTDAPNNTRIKLAQYEFITPSACETVDARR